MSELLPQKPPVEVPNLEPRVLNITDEETADVFAALSSDTARIILSELYEGPATQSELAEHVESSIQNVGYHLERLVDTGLVTVIEEWCSEKGHRMNVYAPGVASLTLVAEEREITADTCTTDDESRLGKTVVQSSD